MTGAAKDIGSEVEGQLSLPLGEPLGAQDDLATLRPSKIVLTETGNVGAALKIARQALDLDVDDIALVTRVPASHLAALEDFDIDRLPARPFAIGYVRAYARALGQDPEAVVARFRAEAPDPDTTLRPPAGLPHVRSRAWLWVGASAALLVLAVGGWNIAQHRQAANARRAVVASAPRPRTAMNGATGLVPLGAPLPPPPEASTPPAYQTPGLASVDPTQAAAASPPADVHVGAPFVLAGPIYGQPGDAGAIILQARKPTSLIARGAGGVIYFARQLAAGEAWRAPVGGDLTVDVGNPASIEVFANGVSRGAMTAASLPLARLGQ